MIHSKIRSKLVECMFFLALSEHENTNIWNKRGTHSLICSRIPNSTKLLKGIIINACLLPQYFSMISFKNE